MVPHHLKSFLLKPSTAAVEPVPPHAHIIRTAQHRLPAAKARHLNCLLSTQHRWRMVCWLIIGLWSCAFPATSLAQWSSRDTLITRSLRGRDVLRVSANLQLPAGTTCGLVEISLQAPKPSPADRQLVAVVYLQSYGRSVNPNVAYRSLVQLTEGQTVANVSFPFTCDQSQCVWDLGLFEEGRDIEDKRNRAGYVWSNNQNIFPTLGALVGSREVKAEIDTAVQDLAEQIADNRQSGRTVGAEPLADVVRLAEANDNWRSYLTRGVWLIAAEAVTELRQRPSLATGLRIYVSAGGTLLVHSLSTPEHLEAVESLLKSPAQSDTTTEPAWTDDYRLEHALLTVEPGSYQAEPLKALAEHPLAQQVCFGKVLLTADTLDKLKNDYWQTSLTQLLDSHQLTSDRDGDWFWRNLIRAVGQPPVWIFCGMVALFGAVLGPGLLALTARLRRRSLMIFLVPLISLVATLAIIVYGILHEGFQTHIRVTSVQALDTTLQSGFVWSRQNYFCALPPREGIYMGAQTHAREVAAEYTNSNFSWDGDPRRGVTSTITMLPEQQNWSGWLKPRQQQQLLIGHPANRLDFPLEVTCSEAGQIQLTNRSPQQLPIVVLRGAGYDYYVATELAASSSVTLRSDDPPSARAKVAKLMARYRPMSPPELGEGGSLLDFGSGQARYSTQNYEEFDEILNNCFKRRLSDQMELPPFGFALLTTTSEAVEVPLTGISSENLHLLMGLHRW